MERCNRCGATCFHLVMDRIGRAWCLPCWGLVGPRRSLRVVLTAWRSLISRPVNA